MCGGIFGGKPKAQKQKEILPAATPVSDNASGRQKATVKKTEVEDAMFSGTDMSTPGAAPEKEQGKAKRAAGEVPLSDARAGKRKRKLIGLDL